MTYSEHTSFDKHKKIGEKHPAFKDKSGDINKVVIVRRRLMWHFICTIIFRKFWCILLYCKPNSKVYKKISV